MRIRDRRASDADLKVNSYSISVLCDIFELLLGEDAHADALHFVGDFAMDAGACRAHENEEAADDIHGSLNTTRSYGAKPNGVI